MAVIYPPPVLIITVRGVGAVLAPLGFSDAQESQGMITKQGYAYLTNQAALPGAQLIKNLWSSGQKAVSNAYNSARTSVFKAYNKTLDTLTTPGGVRNAVDDAYAKLYNKLPKPGEFSQTILDHKGAIAAIGGGIGIGAYMGNKAYNSYNAYPQPQQYYGAYPQQYYGYYPQQMPGPGQPMGNAYGAAPYVNQG